MNDKDLINIIASQISLRWKIKEKSKQIMNNINNEILYNIVKIDDNNHIVTVFNKDQSALLFDMIIGKELIDNVNKILNDYKYALLFMHHEILGNLAKIKIHSEESKDYLTKSNEDIYVDY